MDKALFDILVCPSCNGKLLLTRDAKQLICQFDKLAYDIKDDIPMMLVEQATRLSDDDISKMEFR